MLPTRKSTGLSLSGIRPGSPIDGEHAVNTRMARILIPSVAALMLASPASEAYEKGDWILQAGIGSVDPKSNNGAVASVDAGTSLIISGEYMLSDNLGFEILAAWPFTHDIKLAADGTKVGETKQLPPTFSLKYHFTTDSAFVPYIGAGLNYTIFFDEKTTGPLDGVSLKLDDSVGVAAQLGLDYEISDTMMLNLDLRWMNIETDASLDGVFLETVEIDPVVYGITFGWKF
jgi:outer membrane protein